MDDERREQIVAGYAARLWRGKIGYDGFIAASLRERLGLRDESLADIERAIAALVAGGVLKRGIDGYGPLTGNCYLTNRAVLALTRIP